ncbi:O-acetylhomoserine sulfhydrylase / O-succinylhomoserine sulfhydrylase [Halorubrum sp. DM2]|uniref:CoA-binding protein n=1 Tax=Halorubrum sp. DM2 TaxID=2527867 RepID=UPI0024B78462|nr:CoA-binding protein [Halorubrum sp. DM2]VTT87984.1 O-acetylhomoserine sulfhydrylase / O-succinylhomoserine sulfhydrylase [Halorubrum sp. DM2]
MLITDDEGLDRLLDAETIAVVGCSTTPGKAAHDVPAYLQEHGYRVIPVNPYADEILGERAYDAVGDVEETIDLVDVFRPSEEVPEILDAVRERHASRGDAGAAWLQLGISHDEAATNAAADGIDVVQDRCIKVEHGRLRGEK